MIKKGGLIASILFLVGVSCAIITVNIYFPEKDVKEAYKTLEEELMRPEQPMQKDDIQGETEGLLEFEFVSSAYAQEESIAEKITAIVKNMPEVVNAYKEMGARIADVDRLRDSGIVGEGNSGLLVLREGTLSPSDKMLIDRENKNRLTVIKGMAKAIIRINRIRETEDNISKVMPQAVKQFAAIRRESAKKGWWIQDPSGNWVKK